MAVREPVCVDGPAAGAGTHLLARLLARGLSALRAPTVLDLSFPRDWDGRLAYAISWIASPPVAAAVALGVAAAVQAVPGAWAWAGFYVALGIATPVVYLVWLARTGRVTDLDVQLRRQRARPLLFTLTCGALATLFHSPFSSRIHTDFTDHKGSIRVFPCRSVSDVPLFFIVQQVYSRWGAQ